jgi:hypothetical protein
LASTALFRATSFSYCLWSVVNARVPQGSILGPLFLVYINDIVDNQRSDVHQSADHTSLHVIVDYAKIMQSVIDKNSVWASRWLVTFHPSKSETMVISRKSGKRYTHNYL